MTETVGKWIGLVPAAGRATRLAPLPCSKELFPVGFWVDGAGRAMRPKAVSHYLLEKMGRAGARHALVVLREGKWDIPAYFGSGDFLDLDLAYVVMRRPWGVPFTVDDAYSFVRDSWVVFGFPDILFTPDDAFVALVERQRASGADLVLGVFPARRPDKDDMIELDARGKILRIDIKPRETTLRHTWLIAAWGPSFTELLHAFVQRAAPEVEAAEGMWRGREMFMGDVVWHAVERGMHVSTVLFEHGTYVDIGTPEELAAAVTEYSARAPSGRPTA